MHDITSGTFCLAAGILSGTAGKDVGEELAPGLWDRATGWAQLSGAGTMVWAQLELILPEVKSILTALELMWQAVKSVGLAEELLL
jgi:hypothetical protein